jgi:hypothetical protein
MEVHEGDPVRASPLTCHTGFQYIPAGSVFEQDIEGEWSSRYWVTDALDRASDRNSKRVKGGSLI